MVQQPTRDLTLIFPIKDELSAWLMSIKADCLFQAAAISEAEMQRVQAQAAEMIDSQKSGLVGRMDKQMAIRWPKHAPLCWL